MITVRNEMELSMYHLLHILKEQSECIDKQVACIITDQFGNVLCYGVNEIIECDKNCNDKKNRICEVAHAEIVAVCSLYSSYGVFDHGKRIKNKAWLSLFPCIPCQEALAPHVDEIIVFGKKHKDQVFENITLLPDYGNELIEYNGVVKQLSIVQGELSELIHIISDYAFRRKEKEIDIEQVCGEIVDVELMLHVLKLILWKDNHELFNVLKDMRIHKLFDVFGKLIAGLL